ncbi:5-formyltetrahydrofolate cyclo-ligase [Paraherbaspirillum soli]|uniref:5-formyltetrahydrofolate cyclo-ligase n=1 Tax=Paraherbaspirillum soli TaxID=631222 RepID=A0ABW0M4Z5_9BURK
MVPSIARDAGDATPENAPQKALLRRSLLATRQAVDAVTRHRWDAELCQRVIAWATLWGDANPGCSLGVYWPMREEPDLRPAYAALAAHGMQLALPVVSDKESPLQFVVWTPDDAMVKDICGVPIPASAVATAPLALLVPCVGFNRQRTRLGYGGGFYDRTLALHPRPTTVGIAYSCGLAEFDAAPHDIPLDAIITETISF